jgi:hypothetical protein
MRPVWLVLVLCAAGTNAGGMTWRARIQHSAETASPSSPPQPAMVLDADNEHESADRIRDSMQKPIDRDIRWRPVLNSWLHQSKQESVLGEKQMRVLAEYSQFLFSTGLVKPPNDDELQPTSVQTANNRATRAYIEEYQRSARQHRVTASRQRLEGLLTSALSQMQQPQQRLAGRRARRKAKSNSAQERDTSLTLVQLNMLVETLQSAKQAALEAVELDGGSETTPSAWLRPLNMLLDVLPATRAVTAPQAAADQLSYGFWPIHDGDVIELASALCRFHVSLRPAIRDM